MIIDLISRLHEAVSLFTISVTCSSQRQFRPLSTLVRPIAIPDQPLTPTAAFLSRLLQEPMMLFKVKFNSLLQSVMYGFFIPLDSDGDDLPFQPEVRAIVWFTEPDASEALQPVKMSGFFIGSGYIMERAAALKLFDACIRDFSLDRQRAQFDYQTAETKHHETVFIAVPSADHPPMHVLHLNSKHKFPESEEEKENQATEAAWLKDLEVQKWCSIKCFCYYLGPSTGNYCSGGDGMCQKITTFASSIIRCIPEP